MSPKQLDFVCFKNLESLYLLGLFCLPSLVTQQTFWLCSSTRLTNMQKCLVKSAETSLLPSGAAPRGRILPQCFCRTMLLEPASRSVTCTISPSAGNNRVRQRRRLPSLCPSRQGELTRRCALASSLPPWYPFGKLAYPPVLALGFPPSCHVPQLRNPSTKSCARFWESPPLLDSMHAQRPSS